ncbi:MAG: bile acid:sodium symporter [Deltaproteobacteria bacterium]|nr:bile acid:sodium symporter [Deltaproteobacteria bacterium]
MRRLKENWFLLSLLAVCALTLGDPGGAVAGAGKWLKVHYGPNAVICLIFLFSGMVLRRQEIRSGIGDVKGTTVTLVVIFVAGPAAALLLNLLPLDPGLTIGLILVGVMPTTLTSGVVMTGAAGGNIAHALLITILANGLSVFTVPLSLAFLLGLGEGIGAVPIDRAGMTLQIGLLVLMPLFLGMALRPGREASQALLGRAVPIVNQCLVLAILWMAFSEAKSTVLGGGLDMVSVLTLSFLYHALLLLVAFGSARVFSLGAGRRESVIFMGGQKTLPLSVLIQVTLFPSYGLALAFCVVHHLIHLMMDGYLVGLLRRKGGVME